MPLLFQRAYQGPRQYARWEWDSIPISRQHASHLLQTTGSWLKREHLEIWEG
jgi:hypothetical protein